MRKVKWAALMCVASVFGLGACLENAQVWLDRANGWVGQEQPWLVCGPGGCEVNLDLDD